MLITITLKGGEDMKLRNMTLKALKQRSKRRFHEARIRLAMTMIDDELDLRIAELTAIRNKIRKRIN